MKKLLDILLVLSLAACSDFEKIRRSTDTYFRYRKAMEYYNNGEYAKASQLFADLTSAFRGTAQQDSVLFFQAMSMFKQGEEPPPFVKNLLDATIGFVEGIAKEGMKRAEKCPSCGRTLKEVLDEELLGCPDCWITFSKELEATFLKGQYGTTHVGDAPAQMLGGRPAESRASLKRALAAAIRKEEYEKAAEIQRRLDALDAAEGGEAAQ